MVQQLGDALEAAPATETGFFGNESKSIELRLGQIGSGRGRGGMFATKREAEAQLAEILQWEGGWSQTYDIGAGTMLLLASQGVTSARACWSKSDSREEAKAAQRANLDSYLQKICALIFEKALEESKMLEGFLE